MSGPIKPSEVVARKTSEIWYEVTGRGSGKKMDGLHVAHVDRPYGQMQSGCGVAICAAFPVLHPGRRVVKCRACRRVEQGRPP
jgi:hypothetical protein